MHSLVLLNKIIMQQQCIQESYSRNKKEKINKTDLFNGEMMRLTLYMKESYQTGVSIL